jgi:hypothetical protein
MGHINKGILQQEVSASDKRSTMFQFADYVFVATSRAGYGLT